MAKIDLNDYLEKLTEPEDRETVANRAYQRELFEQYVTKDGNFPEQRAQLLEDFRAGKELTGPKGLRRNLGAFDLEYFGRAYLAHYFVRPSPKFHGELDRIWREGVLKGMNPEVDAKRISRADGCRRAIEAPRGHAKSTTFTFKDDLHAAVYGYKHYIIILSDSSEQAEGFLVDIKTELEENAALKEDFGELEGRTYDELGLADHTRLFYALSDAKGAESDGQVFARVRSFVRDISARHKGQTVLVVSHGVCISYLMYALSHDSWDPSSYEMNYIKNLTVTEAETDL